MQYLYVCQFSNGHIKVGRSDKPLIRIATHADRVSCIGVGVVAQSIFECVGRASLAEAELIGRCAAIASKRNAVEWFEGVSYLQSCAWAEEISAQKKYFVPHIPPVNGMTKADAIRLLGGTPKQAAQALGYTSAHAVYMWPDVLRQSVAERVAGLVAGLVASQSSGLHEEFSQTTGRAS